MEYLVLRLIDVLQIEQLTLQSWLEKYFLLIPTINTVIQLKDF